MMLAMDGSDDCGALHAPVLPVLRALLMTLPRPAGPLLDVGCGAGGKAALWTGPFGGHIPLIGVDIDRVALRRAAVHRRFDAIVADAHALPLCASSCGAAVCSATLGLLADPRLALCDMRRVVRPGGWVLVVTATRTWTLAIPWPAALCYRLALVLGAHPGANRDLLLSTPEPAEGLVTLLRDAGWPAVTAGVFVLDAEGDALARALPLLPWRLVRPRVADRLTTAELRECDAIAAQADAELRALALVAIGS